MVSGVSGIRPGHRNIKKNRSPATDFVLGDACLCQLVLKINCVLSASRDIVFEPPSPLSLLEQVGVRDVHCLKPFWNRLTIY